MADTDTMADNAVRCNSNRASNSNGMGDSNGASNSNRMGDGNGASNGMANNTVANSNSNIRVGSCAIVGDLGNIAICVIGVVGDVLDPAVGEVNGVGAVPEAGSIVSLSLLEGSSRELVSHTVLVRVGGDLSEIVVADGMGHRMSHSLHHRPGHGVHHGTSHSHRSSNCHTMANKAMPSHKAMASNKATSSQQLRGSRGGSSQGRDTNEGLCGIKRVKRGIASKMTAPPSWLLT